MTSTERVRKHREKQRQDGKQLVSLYLPKDAIQVMREQSRMAQGDVVANALMKTYGAARE